MIVQENVGEKKEEPGTGASPCIMRAETPVYGGYVIARSEKIIFLKGAIPGELAEVSIHEKKKDYAVATVTNIIEASPFRRTAPCPVFGLCGGCQLQFVSYDRQISMKEEILADALRRIGDLDVSLQPSMTGREFGYRHRAQFKVTREGAVGFYREGTRDVVTIEECPLMVDEINDLARKFRTVNLKGVRELHVAFGDTITLLVKGDLGDEAVQDMLEKGVSGIAFENGDSVGKDYVSLHLDGLRYSVTPWSFFQANWSLNRTLVGAVVDKLSPLENKKILDLYAGAGNFAVPLSVNAGEVTAVEENPYAVEDGRRNIALNGIKNCAFAHMPVERCFDGGKKQRVAGLFGGTRYDVIILDPPRAGLSSDFLRKVVEAGSQRIVYVSCNPATLARDIKRMKERYEVESVRMVDFFPNTYHIEALVLLNLK